MNIDINLIPEELRIKPLIDGKTFAAIIIVVLLACGAFYFYYEKSNTQSDIASLKSQISTTQQQTQAISTNPEAVQLLTSVNQLKATKKSYDAFAATKILLGDSLIRAYALVPSGVDKNSLSITQSASTLVIKGTADSYTYVSDYARALDNDSRFTLVGLPSLNNDSFTLTISVAAGGAR